LRVALDQLPAVKVWDLRVAGLIGFPYAAFSTFRGVFGLDVGGEEFLSLRALALTAASAMLSSSVSNDPDC